MKYKVTDLVPSLKEETLKELKTIMIYLTNISKEYYETNDTSDPFILEDLKRRFDGYMQRMATLYSKTKKYKGAQHVYLEDVRKKVKSEVLSRLMAPPSSLKITQAEVVVYADEEYAEKIKLIENLREFMINVELMYERFETTYQSIVQSQSLAKREYEQSKK